MKKEIDKIIEQLDSCCGMFDYILSPTENAMIVLYIRELEEKLALKVERIHELEEDLQDYDRIFDIWNKRKLIKKFNKEFSKQYVKEEKKKGRKVAGALPDAEYVYKLYYELKKENKRLRGAK
jgi:CO dehydrogenase nickel-insertion accessory protein CooC1